jgi:hypothetical protein
MNPALQVTDADLQRARQDPAFRHELLQHSLELLLGKLQKQRQTGRGPGANPMEMREAVALAVRLAELIQATLDVSRRR